MPPQTQQPYSQKNSLSRSLIRNSLLLSFMPFLLILLWFRLILLRLGTYSYLRTKSLRSELGTDLPSAHGLGFRLEEPLCPTLPNKGVIQIGNIFSPIPYRGRGFFPLINRIGICSNILRYIYLTAFFSYFRTSFPK